MLGRMKSWVRRSEKGSSDLFWKKKNGRRPGGTPRPACTLEGGGETGGRGRCRGTDREHVRSNKNTKNTQKTRGEEEANRKEMALFYKVGKFPLRNSKDTRLKTRAGSRYLGPASESREKAALFA